MDVVILIDGSTTSNFAAQIDLVRGMLQRSVSPMRYAIVTYGSESSVVSTATSDLAGLATTLSSVTAPGGVPDLGQGAGLARTILQSSILDRPVVVLALTDGEPTRVDLAVTAAQEIRRAGARLFVGLVDDHSEPRRATACDLASRPCDANVEAVESWQQMAQEPERFLVALCSDLDFPPTPEDSALLGR